MRRRVPWPYPTLLSLRHAFRSCPSAMPFWHLHLQRGKRRRPIEPRLARRAVRGHATGVLTARHPTGLRGAALRLWNGATRHPPCPPCLKEGRLQVEPSQTHPVQQIPADPSATTPNHVCFSSVASACRTVLDALAIGTSVVAVALPFGFYFYSGFYIHVVSTLGSAETKKRLGRTRKETWTDSDGARFLRLTDYEPL